MNATLLAPVTPDRLGEAPRPDQSADAAWNVLAAANDLADHATVEACRRVIDASLNGTPAAEADLSVILNYFR